MLKFSFFSVVNIKDSRRLLRHHLEIIEYKVRSWTNKTTQPSMRSQINVTKKISCLSLYEMSKKELRITLYSYISTQTKCRSTCTWNKTYCRGRFSHARWLWSIIKAEFYLYVNCKISLRLIFTCTLIATYCRKTFESNWLQIKFTLVQLFRIMNVIMTSPRCINISILQIYKSNWLT